MPLRRHQVQDQSAANVSQVQDAIDQAAAANKYVFILFWKDQSPQLDKAWGALKPAVTSMADKAVFASIQITNPAEKKIVDKYGVSRAPMPLVLAIAPSGAVTKAFTKTFDEKELRTAFVSPCTEQCLKALQGRKLVFVCVTEKTDPKVALTVPEGVKDFKADKKYGPATEIVLVDAQDENEATFLKELEIGKHAVEAENGILGSARRCDWHIRRCFRRMFLSQARRRAIAFVLWRQVRPRRLSAEVMAKAALPRSVHIHG